MKKDLDKLAMFGAAPAFIDTLHGGRPSQHRRSQALVIAYKRPVG